MPHLFECSIGPVQDFIATARRSRDLWYGSWMLSELSKAAAKALADYELIFPAPLDATQLQPDSALNVANKVVAVITDPPDRVGKNVKAAVQARLQALRDGAFGNVKAPHLFLADLAAEQVDDLLEVYWVSAEILPGPDGYKEARSLADRLLGARKTTRNFQQTDLDLHQPKSSLDGARESVIDEEAFPAPDALAADKQDKAIALFQNFGARPSERLSGVDLLKRLGQRQTEAESFPSTSEMAARPFLRHVDRNDKAGGSDDMLAEIRDMLAEHKVTADERDGAMVYASRLVEWIEDQDVLKTVKKKLDEILTKYADGEKPEPYYALLVADGDNMGTTIDNQQTKAAHRALSQALSEFADGVAGIVKQHQGALIYAGGDDVMAYLPLHTALDCIAHLSDTFHKKLEATGFTNAEGVVPTLSVGLTVAHHLEPLSNTLALARRAEKTAKGVSGKNALAIISSKRSGADRTIQGNRLALNERLQTMIDWHRTDILSAGTPYELQKLHLTLGEGDFAPEGLTKEALRILDRKRESGGQQMEQKTKGEMLAQLQTWLAQKPLTLLEIAHEMIVAKQFADAADLAGVPTKGDA